MAKKSAIDVKALIARAKEQKRANTVWHPNPGDGIAGEVVKMKWIPGKGKDEDGKAIPYLCVTLKKEDGELIVIPAGYTLQEEFELQEAKLHEMVGIFYHGKEGKLGIYSLAIERE